MCTKVLELCQFYGSRIEMSKVRLISIETPAVRSRIAATNMLLAVPAGLNLLHCLNTSYWSIHKQTWLPATL